MRTVGLPSWSLWQAILPHQHTLLVHEDNQAMLRVIETGRNPTMRYLHRTHRVSVAWLHERFQDPEVNAKTFCEESDQMCADIYTKAFTDPVKWVHVCDLINTFDPKRLLVLCRAYAQKERFLPNSGGGQTPSHPMPRRRQCLLPPLSPCLIPWDSHVLLGDRKMFGTSGTDFWFECT